MSVDPAWPRESFGDSPAMADELLALVLSGQKRATCGALRDYVDAAEDLPRPGGRWVVLDGAGRERAVLETTEVRRMAFRDVEEDFALDEGEDDSLEGWRAGHARYFERNGGFDPAMELVCERFRLVEVLE